jgi:hypothetical protein
MVGIIVVTNVYSVWVHVDEQPLAQGRMEGKRKKWGQFGKNKKMGFLGG